MLVGTTNQQSPGINTAQVHRNLFTYLRERLAQRQDSEHQAALIRIVIALFGGCYLVAATWINGLNHIAKWHVIALILIFMPFSIGVLISIFLYPRISVPRRILSMLMDIGATTYVLYFLGAIGTPVYGMYLFNACGNGFRFGPRYLYLSSILGLAGFAFVLATNEYWIAHRTMGVGLVIVLIVIPAYFAVLVRQLHAALASMRVIATCDALTGLPNRHSFYERLRYTLESAEKNQLQFAVVFVDLDGFKPVNDAQGHAAGDAILKSVARRLEESVRKNDVVARFGGDEFVIILFDVHKTAVPSVVRKIITTVARPHVFNGKTVTLTSSAGIAVYPDNGRSIDELMAHADAAMYSAKRAGKNCFCLTEDKQTADIVSVLAGERKV